MLDTEEGDVSYEELAPYIPNSIDGAHNTACRMLKDQLNEFYSDLITPSTIALNSPEEIQFRAGAAARLAGTGNGQDFLHLFV